MKLLYPKDGKAGGSWCAVTEHGNAAVLLNGGTKDHTPTGNYVKSRGIIFLDIMASKEPLMRFSNIILNNIEPFTIIAVYKNHLFELIWTGNNKMLNQLDCTQTYIWSSVTLYDETTRLLRKRWFTQWQEAFIEKAITRESIESFHRFKDPSDISNSIVMNRNNLIKTVSISIMEINHTNATVYYNDLLSNGSSIQQLILTKG